MMYFVKANNTKAWIHREKKERFLALQHAVEMPWQYRGEIEKPKLEVSDGSVLILRYNKNVLTICLDTYTGIK